MDKEPVWRIEVVVPLTWKAPLLALAAKRPYGHGRTVTGVIRELIEAELWAQV